MALALVNGRILNPTPGAVQPWLTGMAVVIESGRISALTPVAKLPADVKKTVDLGGLTLLPGFIDTQVNGGGGVLFNDAPNVDTLVKLADAHRQFGTTAMLPTLISDDLEVMAAAISAVDTAIEHGAPGIIGIHLEGPFLNPDRRGVHNADKFRVIDEQAFQLLCSLRHGKTLVTLAPEKTTADMITRLVLEGVVVAAGHTAADYQQTRAALAAGVSSFTHLFNAMTPMTSREPGVVGAALEDRNSWCGLIVDGHHVHPVTLKNAIAAKQPGRCILVTDAMPSVGSTEKSFRLNGETISASDGRCATASGTLAGSDLDMISAVRNTVKMLGLPLEEAARMASLYPAQMLGIDEDYGAIAPGCMADLIAVDHRLSIQQIWINGITL